MSQIPKFQICLIVKEYIETSESIELHTIADYLENCKNWNDVEISIKQLLQRIKSKF